MRETGNRWFSHATFFRAVRIHGRGSLARRHAGGVGAAKCRPVLRASPDDGREEDYRRPHRRLNQASDASEELRRSGPLSTTWGTSSCGKT